MDKEHNSDGDIPRLEVYLKKSVLIDDEGNRQEFTEGQPTKEAIARWKQIREALAGGYLDQLVESCRQPDAITEPIEEEYTELLDRLVNAVTSEVGRAITGLTFLQLTVKSINPEQTVRLHKAGGRGQNFSWQDGIPMRVLDANFITPILRKYDLIRLNKDGLFMTRSLAENYPYSQLYKAAMRGAREEWVKIVDAIESGKLDPKLTLMHLIAKLMNRTQSFQESAEKTLAAVSKVAERGLGLEEASRFVLSFVDSSTYSARLFEVAMHSLFQVLEDAKVLPGHLKALSQMRSANKKHGNIGDIEVTVMQDSLEIMESWDAKYGKPYLREELEELHDKLRSHSETGFAGFVVDREPNLKEEIAKRIDELMQLHGVEIRVAGFSDWVQEQAKRSGLDEREFSGQWLMAFAETLCQRRRDRAPLDEPADAWVAELGNYARGWKG